MEVEGRPDEIDVRDVKLSFVAGRQLGKVDL